mmetsp:Transcript_28480/g.77117  ORF Transcript_28480/g.77117 Transcript_28480/m.77117 type:complete len:280 (-) Transcript_28480:237-1076(-)|eukprot:CAMPEP_0172375614 /NCGR_PEP_ID=MMETSP1060-20121228/62596_1 /TAXON_ID=37318 /ORGANISM="Pseudo-nitzschia pungens, Strain cf. cingulata" /LENGTH=279 /DNA_ID=CAMNT_0013102817 /DNA_START=51 /DNA_END=890 /DNA_ORIENTATION=+
MVAHTDYHVEGPSQVYGHNHCNNSNNGCDNEHHDDVSVYVTPPKRRRISMESRVRFDEKIMYIEHHTHDERRSPTPVTESSEHSSPSSLWLTPNDFTKIQNNVFTTLEMMKLTGDFGKDTPLSNRYCARGLESLDPERKGSIKTDTLHRRRNVIGAVLHEQNLQQQRIRQERQSRPQQHHNVHGGRNYISTSPTSEHDSDDYHSAPNHMSNRQASYPGGTATSMSSSGLDHFRISLICMNLTYHDTMQGIEYGRQDSEDALEIYRTKPLPVNTNVVQSP